MKKIVIMLTTIMLIFTIISSVTSVQNTNSKIILRPIDKKSIINEKIFKNADDYPILNFIINLLKALLNLVNIIGPIVDFLLKVIPAMNEWLREFTIIFNYFLNLLKDILGVEEPNL